MSDKSDDHSKMLSNRLGQAIHNGELKRVRMYIKQGVDVNMPCYSKKLGEMRPLYIACRRVHEEVMKELLKAGADPNHVPGPVMLMTAERRTLTLSMLRCLISHGADVNLRNSRGKTILHMLARGHFNDTDDNTLSAAKLLLENGPGFYARDDWGRTPAYLACKDGNINVVKLFIAEGADVNFDTGDMTMLRGAADASNNDMFDMLLNAGANRHLKPDALIHPCDLGNHALIARILDTCDTDINMPLDHCGDRTFLRYACSAPACWRNYTSGIMPLLFDHGADINMSLDLCRGRTIIHYACESCDITSQTVRLLLDRGADVRAVSDTGDTALHYAATRCDCNKIRQLFSYNPPLNITNNDNQTPLVQLTQKLIWYYSPFRQQYGYLFYYFEEEYQSSVLAFTMLVTAGALITTDIEHMLNQLRLKHPDAQLPDYEITSTRSLKEMCRFVIRGTIHVPVDVSLCKLPIPKLLQEYLNFSEYMCANTPHSLVTPLTLMSYLDKKNFKKWFKKFLLAD